MSTADLMQGTEEWLAARIGKITASRIGDVMAKGKGGKPSTTRANYLADLVCERTTNDPTPDVFQNWHTKRGTELEPDARNEYEIKRNVTVRTAGLVIHPQFPFSGASPDGLIGDDGLVQFKCPIPAVHLEWLTSRRVPSEHIAQMQWEMACTGAKWSDFVSYCPRFPEHRQLFVKRLLRDDALIAEIAAAVVQFNAEIEREIEKLNAIEDDADLVPVLEKSLAQAQARKAESLEITDEDLVNVGVDPRKAAEAANAFLARERARRKNYPVDEGFQQRDLEKVNRAGLVTAVKAAKENA